MFYGGNLSISFGSISTGLPKDIVAQIIAAEKIPLQNMEGRKQKISEKKQLVGELTKLVEDVRGYISLNSTARSFREIKSITNSDVLGVTLDKNAANLGNYSIEVVQLAQKSSAMSSGFKDPDESYVGVGYISYELPSGESKEIYIDSEHASLNGIAKLINADSSNGMNASVVNDGKDDGYPWRLIISMDGTGDGKKADFPYLYFVDGEDDFYLEFEREAKDAILKIDGFEVQVPGNKVKDLIPGVTLDLKKAKPGEEINLEIKEDTEAVETKFEDVVNKINSVLKFIHTQNKMDENTDTSRTLGGDIILQTLESRFRTALFKDIATTKGMYRIGDLGVTFQRDGLLKFDPQKFQAMLQSDSALVADIISGKIREDGTKSEGFIDNLDAMLTTVLRFPDGVLSSRNKGLQSNIDQIDRRIKQKQRLIDQKEKMLKDKFARLEGTISRIKGQSAGLSALAAGMGQINPVQQLG